MSKFSPVLKLTKNDEDIKNPSTDGGNDEQAVKTTSISGRMLDSAGKPMANVVVTLFSDPITAVTDSNGYFTIKDAPIGTHILRVFKTQADFDAYVKDPNSVKPLAKIKNVMIAEKDGKTIVTIGGKVVDLNSDNAFVFQVEVDGNVSVNPKTGDTTNIFIPIALIGLSSLALCFTI